MRKPFKRKTSEFEKQTQTPPNYHKPSTSKYKNHHAESNEFPRKVFSDGTTKKI